MNSNIILILQALLAIAIGSVGVIAIFYGLNILVEKTLPQRARLRVLPWIYVGPSIYCWQFIC
jgi:alpha-glucoside transport system permease protein